jgi:hypothetical protein
MILSCRTGPLRGGYTFLAGMGCFGPRYGRRDILFGEVFGLGGSRGAGDSEDAGWGSESADAGGRWQALGGEVSE